MKLVNNLGDTITLDGRYNQDKIKELISKGNHSEIDSYLSSIKGYPTHEKGGIDLTIGSEGVSIKNGKSSYIAEKGLVLKAIEDVNTTDEKEI